MDEKRLSVSSILDPRIFATVTLIVIQVSIHTAIGVSGGGFLAVRQSALERYGALVRALVWDEHQYWRLLTAMFLHQGLLHLAVDAVCIFLFGSCVEIALGKTRYLVLYIGSGLAGNLAAILWAAPMSLSLGATGVVFGLLVAYMMMLLRGPTHWTEVVRQPLSRLLFFLVGIQLAMGLFLPGITTLSAQAAGLVTGATLGFFLLSWAPVVNGTSPRRQWLRWTAVAVWVAAFAALAFLTARPPRSVARRVEMALYYVFKGERRRALDHFDAATAKDTSATFAWLDRAVPRAAAPRARVRMIKVLLEFFGNDVAAHGYYGVEARLHPSPETFWLTATLLQKPAVANYKEALATCAEGQKRFPREQDWDLLEAEIHTNFRQFDQALAVLNPLATTTEPVGADYFELAARCHARCRQWAEVERVTSRALAASWLDVPDFDHLFRTQHDLIVKEWRYRALKQLGKELQDEALRAEMEKDWRDLIGLTPDDAVGLNNLAWFLATHGGDLVEAAQLAEQSVNTQSEAYNLDTLAWIEHLRGNNEKAWATMQQAIAAGARSPSPEYCYHAAAILAALGKKDEARAYCDRAIAPGVDFDDFEAAQDMVKTFAYRSSKPRTDTDGHRRARTNTGER